MSCMQETALRTIRRGDIGINTLVPTICIGAGTFGSLVNTALRQCIAKRCEALLDGPIQILSIRWANKCQNGEKQRFLSIEPFQIASFVQFLRANDQYFDRWFPQEYNLELIQHTPENRLLGRLGFLFDLWLRHNFVEAVQTALDRVKLIDWCEKIETDFINLFVVASTGDGLSSGIFWDLCLLLPRLLEEEEIAYKLNAVLAFGDVLALNNRSARQVLNANTHVFLTELYYYCVEAEGLKARDVEQESDNIANDTPFSELFLPFDYPLDTLESPQRFCDNIYIMTKRNASGFTLDGIEKYAQMAATFIALNVNCQCYGQIEKTHAEENNLLKSFCLAELSQSKKANVDIERAPLQATPFFSQTSSNAESFSCITIDDITEAEEVEPSTSAEAKEQRCSNRSQLSLSTGVYNREILKKIQKYRRDYQRIEEIGGYPFIDKRQEDVYGWQAQAKDYTECEGVIEVPKNG